MSYFQRIPLSAYNKTGFFGSKKLGKATIALFASGKADIFPGLHR